jgi:hypothetical protein
MKTNSENAIVIIQAYLCVIMDIPEETASIHAEIIIRQIEKHILKGKKL